MTAREIGLETDWYRRGITSLLHRYTFLPNLCIALAPVRTHFYNFYPRPIRSRPQRPTANQKSPSKTHGQSEVAL